jgi:two-component system, NarL family, invasion response regulator UvrY
MRGKNTPISVLLVDDHAVVREGYRRLLERHSGIVVIGEAADAATAHALFCHLEPQIVVMDITLPKTNGIAAMENMLKHKPDARVLIFSMHEDAVFATRAMQAGAFGYVTKASAPHVLVEALHSIASGIKYLNQEIAQKLALRQIAVDRSDVLSAREVDVLHRLAQGQTVAEIAQLMGLSSKTVANHQSAIKLKLEVDTAMQLLQKAKELGIS